MSRFEARTTASLVKVNSTYIKHKVCVNLVAQASPAIELGTVQTATGKVEPARKFKCTMAARASI